MPTQTHPLEYTEYDCRAMATGLFPRLADCETLQKARATLVSYATDCQMDSYGAGGPGRQRHELAIARDCARALRTMSSEHADSAAGFSLTQALWDLARWIPRPDLHPGFFAEIYHLLRGVEGSPAASLPRQPIEPQGLSGREAAVRRSDELDQLWADIETTMSKYADGLTAEAQVRRAARRDRILAILGGSHADWDEWGWQVRHVVSDPALLERLVALTPDELDAVRAACDDGIPFGITPYYLSLMDDVPGTGRDRAVRAQVLPPPDYVREMAAHRGDLSNACDFMREHDTSPVDLVTRRYPSVAILKPFNTCPQICVYCQRNWEIARPMDPDALVSWEKIEAACRWIEGRPAIHEVLVTGGDPLALPDADLLRILQRVAQIPQVDMIRIGTRVPVTIPMRITETLAESLGRLREPGRRDVCIVTHVEHPYEITPDLVTAVDRLRRQGLGVYNQLVYTFFVSRRFEAARLRLLLRRCGIDPYYTFAPKGKRETLAYRVPIARILQEQKEEARLLPGSRRTDEPVYNLPGLGKNYLRALQHRDLLSILPDGSRIYEFHPWEKNIARRGTYVGADVPIRHYLQRLAAIGEDPRDYGSIWYYS